jgi:hypothetical protein
MLVIVPNCLRDEINAAIDTALIGHPDAEPDREIFYDTLLAYFNEHGVIPEFTLEKRATTRAPGKGD